MIASHSQTQTTANSLTDQAREEIATAIRERQLRPGQILSEGALASSLGMSRTPIREALGQLEQEGYVVVIPGVGTQVAELTLAEVIEICETLDALDTQIAGWAAERGSDEALTAIGKASEAMASLADEGDRLTWATADSQFHEFFAVAAGNTTAARTVKTLRGRLRRISIGSATRPERLVACTDEHVKVASAVLARHPEEARALMHAHLLAMRASIIDMLERQVIPVIGERF
ncbi:MAG: GntR family transcriptional regulator [Actinobacteria bacterium]|nr:GntR family transcriptional regulator [Actinomycetota bacterium]